MTKSAKDAQRPRPFQLFAGAEIQAAERLCLREQTLDVMAHTIPPAQNGEITSLADVWLPTALDDYAPRKSGNRKRKDSLSHGSGDQTRIVKEKSSWLNMPWVTSPSAPASPGSWTPAVLKFKHECAELRIYNEKTDQRYHLVHVNKLQANQIQSVHYSLGYRNYTLGLYCPHDAGMSVTAFQWPIYLSFHSVEMLNAWIVLLRTYAKPELYGTSSDGYRIWRSMNLYIKTAERIRAPSSFAIHSSRQDVAVTIEQESKDLDLFCEIRVNQRLCARTSVQKGQGLAGWMESFLLRDLPPLESLSFDVWQEKKNASPLLLGSVSIPVHDFIRGEYVDGFFPILTTSRDDGTLSTHAGDLNIELKLTEEIVIPQAQCNSLMRLLDSSNWFSMLGCLDPHMSLDRKYLIPHIVAIAVARGRLMDLLKDLANHQIVLENSSSAIFRSNTDLSAAVDEVMKLYGKDWLEASIGPVVRQLIQERVTIELEPSKTSKGIKEYDQNVKTLVLWLSHFWKRIWAAREECPPELRELFSFVRKIVDQKFSLEQSNARWQCVSAFAFLRYIVPAIISPDLFNLCHGQPNGTAKTTLIHISKTLQKLANLKTSVDKEEFNRSVKEFLQSHVPVMIDYLVVISTPKETKQNRGANFDTENASRLQIITTVHQKSATFEPLHRESIPLLPHLIDITSHLVTIASIMVRHLRKPEDRGKTAIQKLATAENIATISRLFLECFELESQALYRVKKTARRHGRLGSQYSGRGRTSDSVEYQATVEDTLIAPGANPRRRSTLVRRSRSVRPGTIYNIPSSYSRLTGFEATPEIGFTGSQGSGLPPLQFDSGQESRKRKMGNVLSIFHRK
ncbi:Rho GTPase activation protein [Sistotremastrum suecicum HHB10207 ss-3]|uniref:Rho GTPase activation protein n=1 Tax=Sistotremastrum suecicum HHB10207 ss-3 TaxID=1314776 RepID=A0A166J4V3_9AGAM|nr:Rho GTPase activation protein [Sistotremastrum suecicum HHB10207 ss-3]